MTPNEGIEYLHGMTPASPGVTLTKRDEACAALEPLVGRDLDIDPLRREALRFAVEHNRLDQSPEAVVIAAGEYERYLRSGATEAA